MHKGSCLCGAVTFEVDCELPGPDGCHCSKCRKHSGHFFASTDVPRSSVRISGESNVTWFQSSQKARRGFCSVCGSSLFWDPVGRDWTGIAMGAFDTPTGTSLALHIYTADKGDYYAIGDGAEQFEQVPPAPH